MKKLGSITRKLPAAAALCAVFLIWQIVSMSGIVPSFMLPAPREVWDAFWGDFPILMQHGWVTLREALLGLAIGVAVAFVLALLMHRFGALYRALYPLIVMTQTIPTIAIAPLLVLWMGFDMAPKITLVALTTFFPITVSLLEGYDAADHDAAQLLRSMGANRWQIFYHLEFPAALGYFFSGLRVSVSYAVVGAVISEWLGGFEGLGVYMTRVKKAYAFDKMFAVIFLIVAVSLLLMSATTLLRRAVMPWERCEKKERNE